MKKMMQTILLHLFLFSGKRLFGNIYVYLGEEDDIKDDSPVRAMHFAQSDFWMSRSISNYYWNNIDKRK